MGYCHCNSCRSWSAAPVNAFTLWKPENVKVTKGADLVGHFMKTTMSDRQYCTKFGGHLMNNHPPLGLVDVYAATIPSVKFVPVVHVNYAETVLPMRDGLPKLKDFPAEMAALATKQRWARHRGVTGRLRGRVPFANGRESRDAGFPVRVGGVESVPSTRIAFRLSYTCNIFQPYSRSIR
jgi:hypothetical protein